MTSVSILHHRTGTSVTYCDFLRHKFINPGEIPMETVFLANFLDTLTATHDKNHFQSDFCCSSFLS